MAIETLGLPDPVSPNVNDGAQVYDLAVGFSTLVEGNALGVEWFTPLSPPGITPVVKWWRVSDESLIASKSFSAVAGTRQEILFDTPVLIDPDDYRVSVETIFFTLTTDWTGWPASSASMITDNPDGWLSVGPGFPDNGVRTALYHVSPIFEPGGVDPPAEGSAATIIDLAPAAIGARASQASAALGLDLAVSATGSSPNGGSAALTIDLALAAAGRRAAAGAAALGLNLAVVTSGGRESNGASALQLNFSVSAIGSNGDIGCPVPAFPFSPTSPPGYPWTPRPVMSFPGGECT